MAVRTDLLLSQLPIGTINTVIGYLGSTAPSFVGAFIGATSGVDGTIGIVPKPLLGQQTYFLKGDGTWGIPAGSGDMLLGTVQTVTASKTFNNSTLLLRNVANTFSGQFTNTITAARTWTLPDVAGTVVLTSGLTTNRIPYATGTATLSDNAAFGFDPTNGYGYIGNLVLFLAGSGINANQYVGNTFNFTTTGTSNVRIGQVSGTPSLSSGSTNLTIGHNAAFSLSTGSNNIAIGHQAQDNLTTGSNNIAIGANAIDIQSPTASNQLTIQNIIFGTGNSGTGTTVSTGSIGIGVASPTGRLHLPAGTATANTAPLKLTTGTALTTPENGAIEYHSSHLYFTIGSTRYQLDQQSGGGGGMTNPMTTTGDLILGGASGTPTRLGIGANTFVLTSNGTTASWVASAGGGGSSYATIQVDATPLTQRTVLNFVGSVNAVDDAGNSRTNVTLSTTLEAFATYNTDGILTQTAANTFTGRTLTQTANRIAITNADGVAGNPTIDVGVNIIDKTVTNTYTTGATQIFGHTGTNAGLRLASSATAPSALTNGDLWSDSTLLDVYAQINGVSTALTRTVIEDVTGTTYTFVEADRNKIKRFTHASGCTANIPNSLSLNWSTTVYRDSASVLTITATGTLQGAGTTLNTNQTAATIQHRGSNIHILIGSVGTAAGSGDMLLGTSQTVTALKTFNTGTFALNNPANTFAYNFLGSAIVANRNVTLPLLTASDIFVMEAFGQTLTNKTLGSGTVISASPTINDGITVTFNPSGTNAGINIGAHTAAPSSLVDFDIWGDSTALDFYGRVNGVTTALTRQVWEDVTGTTYTFTEADRNKIKRFTNASGCTATIPTGLSNFWQVTAWRDNGAGIITFASNGTLESTGTTMNTVKSYATVCHRGSNIHSLGGAIGSTPTFGAVLSVTTSSTLTTAVNTIYNVFVDATAGNIVITLPTGSSTTEHRIIRIDSTSNTVTFIGTVSGVNPYLGTVGLLPLNAFTLIFNGTNFFAI